MKRMIAFLFMGIFLFCFKLVNENTFPDFNYEKIIIISKNETLFENAILKNNNQYYFVFDKESGEDALKKIDFKEIDGLVYYLNKEEGINSVLNQIDFFYPAKENIDGMDIYYGYDSSYPDFRILNNKKINVQIVENSTNIIIGFPMILCGY